jgi:hypothetical protein
MVQPYNDPYGPTPVEPPPWFPSLQFLPPGLPPTGWGGVDATAPWSPPTLPAAIPASGWGGLDLGSPPVAPPTGWGGLEGTPQLPPMVGPSKLDQYLGAIAMAKAGGSTYTGYNPPVVARSNVKGGTPSGFDAKGNKMSAAPKVLQGQLGNNGRQGSGMTAYNKVQEVVGTLATQLAAMTGTSPDAWSGRRPEELVAAIAAMQGQGNDQNGSGSGAARAAAKAAAAQQAAKEQAIQQYLGELDKNRLAQQGALDQQYGAINAGYDAAGTQLGSLNQQAADRQAGIMSDLGAQAATSRTNTAATYQAGDKRLADLQAQYATQQAAQQAGSDRLTGAFGAPQAYGGGSAANDMFAAGRAQNTMMGNGADAMFADRGNVYNALGADASTARGNQFDVLMTKLKLQQQQSAAAQAKSNADLAAQYNDRRLSVYG